MQVRPHILFHCLSSDSNPSLKMLVPPTVICQDSLALPSALLTMTVTVFFPGTSQVKPTVSLSPPGWLTGSRPVALHA